jgi:hypothetical protein
MTAAIDDPATIFIAIILALPALLADNWSSCISYFLDPWMITTFGLLFAVVHVTKSKLPPQQLSVRDQRIASWYLVNGIFIQFLMDGLVGGLQQVPVLRTQYEKLDARYRNHDPTVMIISLIELFIMSPLCLVVYYGYHRKTAWRAPVELVTCTLHAMGTVVFVGSELLVGLKDVPCDWTLSFSIYHLIYFWFAFVFCNTLWIALPTRLAIDCIQQVTQQQQQGPGTKGR